MEKHLTKHGFASWLVIGVGVVVAWGLVCSIGAQLVSGLFSGGKTVRENLHVTLEGQVLIVRTTYQGNTEGRKDYRTLDGEVVQVTSDQTTLGFSRLPNLRSSGVLLEKPLGWQNRIGATTDLDNPATYWFLLRDDSPTGLAYLVGYDAITRRIVGYLSRKGFSETCPSTKNQFDLRGHLLGHSPPIQASTRYMEGPDVYPGFRFNYETSDTLPKPWILFLSDRERIWKIDLRDRTLKSFEQCDDVIALRMVREPLPSQKNEVDNETAESSRKTVNRLAVRRSDQIEIWNTSTDEKRAYSIPESLRDQDLSAVSLGDGHLLVKRGYGPWGTDGWTELVWLDDSGGEARTEKFQLQGWATPNPRKEAWKLAGLMPVPAAWSFLELIGTPFRFVNERIEPNYGSALTRAWRESWPACVTVLLLSVIAALLALRWHKRNYRSGGMLWAAFVFLLGVPGLVAYWLHFRGSPVAKCSSCGQQVPRDRDACARCAEPFPEPVLKGTEIFA